MSATIAARIAWIAGLLLLAAGAWLLWERYAARWQAQAPSQEVRRAAADRRVPVVVVPAETATDRLVVEAVGSARARRSAALRPAVAGEVASVHFRAGARVRTGQRLLQLVDRHERLAADLAAADVDIARRLLQRYAGTEGTGAVPSSVIDEARSNLRRAEIMLAQAREALADRVLRAPFAGVVGLPEVEPGDRVTPDSVVGTLDDRSRLELEFDLPETYLGRLRVGHPVRASTVAYAEREFAGEVTEIDSRVAADTRSLRVRAELPNEDDLLRPGQSFRVWITFEGGAHLEVPELALQWGRDGGHLWVLRDGAAVKVPVRLVRRLDGTVLVDGEIEPGERVVVEGVHRLRPGRPVEVVEASP